MSKLIVEMEMQKDLAVIVTILPDGRIFKHLGYKDKKQIGKILGTLPEEHGDLIDRDELKEKFCDDDAIDNYAREYIDAALTVIAAERKDDGN